DIENKIATFTGGRAAEEIAFGAISTGASNDIEQATSIARAMITRYGMSESFGMTAFEQMVNPYLGNDTTMNCSQETAARIDREVIALIEKAYDQAKTILKDNRSKLDEIARVLIARETITGQEFMDILNAPVALPAKQEPGEETENEG
ncbi:MAG: cell division protein FtsH, partial [Clostridia bacterium]|nr:cell division protein FtsH [Clostridia bacterium]